MRFRLYVRGRHRAHVNRARTIWSTHLASAAEVDRSRPTIGGYTGGDPDVRRVVKEAGSRARAKGRTRKSTMKNHLIALAVILGSILAGCSSSSSGGGGTSCASSDGSQCVEVNSGTTCPSPLTSVSSCPSGGELGECVVTSGNTTENQFFYCKGEAVTAIVVERLAGFLKDLSASRLDETFPY